MTQENTSPEQEQRIAEKQIDSGMDQEQAQKEVAKEDVESKTGQSFEKTRRLAIDVMEVNDALEKQEAGSTAREMADIDLKEVQEMNEKMAQGDLADEIVRAGLGPQFLSTGAIKLEHGAKTVAEKSQLYGDGETMEKMIQDATTKEPGLPREQVEKMSPDELKDYVQEPQVAENVQAEKVDDSNSVSDSDNLASESQETKDENSSLNLREILAEASALGETKTASENLDKILKEDSQKGQQKIQQNDQLKKKQQKGLE